MDLCTIENRCAGRTESEFSVSTCPENICVRAQFADSPEFQRLVMGANNVKLARIALEIARDAYADLDIEAYLKRIEALAARASSRFRPGANPRDIIGQINWILYVEEGFGGNREEYYDPRNSYLNEVLDRKLGIPISLSVVYWTVAEHLGLSMAGVNLPAHFMLRVDENERTWFVDPFHAGAIYNRRRCEQRLSEIAQQPVVLTDSLAAPCSILVVVARMLKNLKAIYWNTQDVASILPIQRRLVALSQNEPAEVRDLGVLCVQADLLGQAIDPLEAYLQTNPPSEDAREIRVLLDVVRRQLASLN
jgi:regulator of sirC expression with transglutaminase-like and TPR domain